MSKSEPPFGLTVMEKLVGLFVILIGVIIFYETYINVSDLGSYPIIFLVAGLVLIGLGIVMLLAKTE